MMEGTLVQIRANAVVMATGGAGRAIAITPTASSPAMAWAWRWATASAARHGVCPVSPNRPADLGILMTEAAAAKAVFW